MLIANNFFTTCACQYLCNPTGINNNHNSGEENGKIKSEVICKIMFYKMEGKVQDKNSARQLY